MRSGPTAAAGAPPVRTLVPSARTTSRPTTRSSTLPYRVEYWPAPRQATQPPTVASSKLCGKWPTLIACRDWSSASRSGPNVPASTSTMPDVASTSTSPASPVMSRTHSAEQRHRRAAHAAAPGRGGDRDAGGRARPHDRCDSAGSSGRTTSAARAAPDRPAPSASPVATSRGWRRRPARRRSRPGRSRAARRPGRRRPSPSPDQRASVPVSSIGGVGSVITPRREEALGRASFSSRIHELTVRGDLAGRLARRPTRARRPAVRRRPAQPPSVADRLKRWARVRRTRTSSRVQTISWRAA